MSKTKNVKNKPVQTSISFNWLNNIRVQLFFIAFFGVLIYAQTLSFEYTNWDDLEYISNNTLIKDLRFNTLPQIFSSFVMGNYHPITILSFALEVKLFGESAGIMHGTNFILHVINSILVLLVLRKINSNWLLSFFPAMLFLVHPLHVESVAWISERKDVLYCFFLFLSVLVFFNYKSSDKKSMYLASIVLFVFSLLSKGQAVVLPLVLICLEVIKYNKFNFKELLINKIPFFVLSLVFGVIAIKAQSSVDVIAVSNNFSFLEQFVYGFNGLFFYLASTLFPYKLATLYIYPDVITTAFYLKSIVAILIIALIFIKFKNNKQILFSFILFFVAILPVLQFLPVGNAMYADRYYYLPSIGVFLFLAFLIEKYTFKFSQKIIISAITLLIIVFTSLSFTQVKVWQNSFTLWEQVRVNYPKTPSAWYNTGNYFMKSANPDYKTALPYFIEATQLKQNYPKAYNNLGVCYYNLGNYNKALVAYTTAYQLDNSQVDLALNVGKANDMLENYNEAIKWFNTSLALDSTSDIVYYNLGISNFKKGNIDSSIYFYNKALLINPNNAEVYNNLGTSFIYKKNFNDALLNYNKAISINPTYSEPYFNKALTQQVLGDSLAMIYNLKLAASYGHQQAKLYLNQNSISN